MMPSNGNIGVSWDVGPIDQPPAIASQLSDSIIRSLGLSVMGYAGFPNLSRYQHPLIPLLGASKATRILRTARAWSVRRDGVGYSMQELVGAGLNREASAWSAVSLSRIVEIIVSAAAAAEQA